MFTKMIKTSCLLAGVFAMSFANATTDEQMDLTEVTQASTVIVTGEVLSSVTVMQGNSPFTKFTLSIEEQIKGNSPQTITVVIPGGTMKKGRFLVGETVPGVTPILSAQKSLYFLSPLDAKDEYQIVGFNQGQASISTVNGEEIITGTLTGGHQYSLTEMKAKINAADGK